MGRSADVVLLFEHAARELDVVCAIASLLQRRGLRTEIVQWPHGYHRVAHIPTPAVVVLPFCYQERSFSTCLLDWREAAFFNLSWEQLFYSGNRKAKSPRGAFAVRHTVHHAWGEFYARWLMEQGVPRENIFINGHPAYALYQPPYSAYFASRADLAAGHGLDSGKRWVFFPENYNWAFYTESTLRRFIDAGQSEADVREMRGFCDRSLRETLTWCADAARSGDVELILRPRPATTLEEFRGFAERVLGPLPSGLHLIQDGTVREWILASDVVVSSHSTSLIEAALAGKPAFMLAPEAMPAALAVDWHRHVARIGSGAEFLRACLDGSGAGVSRRLATWAEERMMACEDPIQNVADHLARLATGRRTRPPVVSRRDAAPPGRLGKLGVPRAVLFEARRLLRRGQRRRPSSKVEPEHLADLASEATIASRIARWDRLLAAADVAVAS